jgi:hypothetical protein
MLTLAQLLRIVVVVDARDLAGATASSLRQVVDQPKKIKIDDYPLRNTYFFIMKVGQNVTRSYKWCTVTVASDPLLENYF